MLWGTADDQEFMRVAFWIAFPFTVWMWYLILRIWRSLHANQQQSREKIGRLDISFSKDTVVSVHELNDVTTIVTRDRNTGRVTTNTLIGESPLGK